MSVAIDLSTKARAAAKDLIRVYVLRGDSYAHLKESWMGSANSRYWANIGSSGCQPNGHSRRGADAINVTEIDGEKVCFEFSLRELYDEIRGGREQLSLF